ncbi:MAG: Vanadium-dependent haloperoxidase [Bacteroidota bacterium]|nr:Vanadium-dependent haloperoxidase [Bacteroidota bacterium]
MSKFFREQLFLLLCLGLLIGCHSRKSGTSSDQLLIHTLQNALNTAVIHDGFPPPVASRIYAYTSIAAYESMRVGDTFPSLSGKLNDFHLVVPEEKGPVNNRAVMVAAFCKVGAEMVYRGYFIDSVRNKCWEGLKQETDKDVLDRSEKMGLEIAKQILQWAGKDRYKETRNMPRFTPTGENGHWAPTPPTFADALEPYWGTIRTFVVDSSAQFQLPLPPPFSKDKNSEIYKNSAEVMQYVNRSDSFWISTVEYWDCNPQRTYVKGHIMYTQRKLTPGGHWMSIAQNVCKQKKLSEMESTRAYALTSIALADAFITVWREKYRTDYVRPETYIQQYIQKDWRPLIETPTFPEYPSAHSTVSASAAAVLEQLFGDHFQFTDSTEIAFKMQPRKFNSFRQAADQAAISRAYAGIHFMPSCENGKVLGKKVGEMVVEKLIKK